jgi:4-amino-4-deoxy-L-arabinose transferase-like glycosyltransferase
VMVSPLMAFYGPNYLVNASALGLVFVGWWCTWRFHERRDKVFWFGGLLAFGLSFLFRPTMAIGLIPLILFVLFRRSHWRMWVLAIFPVVVATLWVFWSQRVNDLVGSVYYCIRNLECLSKCFVARMVSPPCAMGIRVNGLFLGG